MTANPTKGPWTIEPPANGVTIEHTIKGADGVTVVARGIENPADAAVICAAYDLREAARVYIEASERFVRLHDAASPGLAKSEGRTS